MSKVKRNQAVLTIVMALIALGAYYVQTEGIYDIKGLFAPRAVTEEGFDPIASGDRIEAAVPFVDVVHIGPVRCALNYSPSFHVGVIVRPVENTRSVALDSDGGYVILKPGAYIWFEGKEETIQEEITFWTRAKMEYYSLNGMWKPGQHPRVRNAVDALEDYHEQEMLRQITYAIMKEAWRHKDAGILNEETGEILPWNFIEINFLLLGEPVEKITNRGEYVKVYEERIGRIQICWRAIRPETRQDPDPTTAQGQKRAQPQYYIEDIVARERGLTMDDFQYLQKENVIQTAPGFHPYYGQAPYPHGFNHPTRRASAP